MKPRGGTSTRKEREMTKWMHRMEQKLDTLLKLQAQNRKGNGKNGDTGDKERYVHNGKNLIHLPARDVFAYARLLLDTLFTKEEQGSSLLYESKRSTKPGLDSERVHLLFECVKERYGDNYDGKFMISTLNQKCRDTCTGKPKAGLN